MLRSSSERGFLISVPSEEAIFSGHLYESTNSILLFIVVNESKASEVCLNSPSVPPVPADFTAEIQKRRFCPGVLASELLSSVHCLCLHPFLFLLPFCHRLSSSVLFLSSPTLKKKLFNVSF